MKDYSSKLGVDKKCPVCGKDFFIPSWALSDWGYKKDWRYICSYSCYSMTVDKYNQKHRKEAIYK